VTVANAVMTVDAGPDRSADEGAVFAPTFTFNDPGAPDTHTATIDWGDGGPVETVPASAIGEPATPGATGTISGRHAYGQVGTYTVTVTVDDTFGPAASGSFVLTVVDVAPAVDAGADLMGGKGVPVAVNATFSDPQFPVGNSGETFTASIDWGDGASGAGVVSVTPGSAGVPTTGSVTGSHTYKGNGPYTVTVTTSDGIASGSD